MYIIATAKPMPQLEGNLHILRNELENVPLIKMGAGGVRPKPTPFSVTPPRKLSMVEITDRILATEDVAFTP